MIEGGGEITEAGSIVSVVDGRYQQNKKIKDKNKKKKKKKEEEEKGKAMNKAGTKAIDTTSSQVRKM